jgi:2-dehydro-3-deoxyglucarate aldolase/4-hydroxy-2-oxoheptanedioate aldolase
VGEFVTAGTWPILARSGVDFAVIDMEHGGLTYREVANALTGAQLTTLPALVRVPELSRSAIARVLDLGADGVLIPHIENEDEARQAVRWSKYAPLGIRSAAGPHLDIEAANDGVACIPIIESPSASESIKAICDVPGIDALIVGPTDLSLLLGVYGDFHAEQFVACESRIMAATRAARVPLGTGTATVDAAIERVHRGYDWIVVGSEVPILETGARDAAQALRAAYGRQETRSP